MTNKARTLTIVVAGALMLMLIFLKSGPEGLRKRSDVASASTCPATISARPNRGVE